MVDLIFPAEKDWHHQGANMLELQQHLAHSFEDKDDINLKMGKLRFNSYKIATCKHAQWQHIQNCIHLWHP